MTNRLPTIAIVGRPNVGKSSLFNRVAGRRRAIVEAASGTTRDRLHAAITWKGARFMLVDTAGFESAARDEMSALVLRQIRKGIDHADAVWFVTDARSGVLHYDRDLAEMLRKTAKKIFLIVNKVDQPSDAGKAVEFYELGLGEPYAVSAIHGKGIDRLCDAVVAERSLAAPLPASNAPGAVSDRTIKVAIVGRPNVGKSSYLNALLDEERVVVHPTAGTTRDAVDTEFRYGERDYILIDTAGIRHHPKLQGPVDFYGGVRTREAIERCDVAVVLIDAHEGLTKDDARILEFVRREGKALVLIVNKWDLLKGVEMARYTQSLIQELRFLRQIPVLFMSCKTGRKVEPSLRTVEQVYDRSRKVMSAAQLVDVMKALNAAPEMSGKRIVFKRLVQDGAAPARFTVTLQDDRSLTDTVKRFVENTLRRSGGLEGVPVKIVFQVMPKKR